MSFQLPISLVHWNCCKDNERFQITKHEVKINSEYPAIKHTLNSLLGESLLFRLIFRVGQTWIGVYKTDLVLNLSCLSK